MPIPGGNVCVMHGGASPNVAAAARARLERAAQAELATKLGLGTFRVEIPGAFAALCRLHRRRPRWFLAAEEVRLDRARREVVVAFEDALAGWGDDVPCGGGRSSR